MWPTPVGLCFDGDSSHAHPLKFEEITAKFENSTYLDELYGLLRFSNLTSWPCLICSARIPFRYCSIASHMSHVGKCIPSKPMFLGWYGRWKKSCTSWYMVYPLIIPLFTMCHSYLPVTNWCRISSIHSMCDIINIYILLYYIYIYDILRILRGRDCWPFVRFLEIFHKSRPSHPSTACSSVVSPAMAEKII